MTHVHPEPLERTSAQLARLAHEPLVLGYSMTHARVREATTKAEALQKMAETAGRPKGKGAPEHENPNQKSSINCSPT